MRIITIIIICEVLQNTDDRVLETDTAIYVPSSTTYQRRDLKKLKKKNPMFTT